jgi:hypothetical protein
MTKPVLTGHQNGTIWLVVGLKLVTVNKWPRQRRNNMTNQGFEKHREVIKLLVEGISFDDGRVKIKAILPPSDRQLHPVAGGLRRGG